MNTDEKILKALEALQTGQKEQSEAIARLERNTATKDDVEQLENGQMRIENEMSLLERGQFAIKQIVTLINQTLVKTVKNHETRIENLEQHTGTTDPTKQ